MPAGTARERLIPGSLAARCPWLRHSWLSRAGSQLTLPHPAPGASRLHTLIPRVACPHSSRGDPLQRSRGKLSFSSRAMAGCQRGSTRGTRPLMGLILFTGTEGQDQGSGADGCTGHGSGHQGEQIPQARAFLTQKEQHWDPHCSLGPVSMRGDLSCLLWIPSEGVSPALGPQGTWKALGHCCHPAWVLQPSVCPHGLCSHSPTGPQSKTSPQHRSQPSTSLGPELHIWLRVPRASQDRTLQTRAQPGAAALGSLRWGPKAATLAQERPC